MVTNKRQARWMIIDGKFGADRLIEFLAALIKDAAKKIFRKHTVRAAGGDAAARAGSGCLW
jgi:pantothenate kinase